MQITRRAAPALALLALAGAAPSLAAQTADSALAVSVSGINLLRLNQDGGFVLRGTADVGALPATGAGARLMWYPGKWAFRAGLVVTESPANEGTYWDASHIGYGSAAFGKNNRASGTSSFAFGESANASGARTLAFSGTASSAGAVAIGKNARTANRQGSIVLGDGCASFSSDSVYPTANNQLVARGCGGIRFYTTQNLSAGVVVAAGGGSWSSVSDRNRKELFATVDGEDVLARLRRVPVTTWNYNTQERGIRHMGPMAQDFHAAFGLGEDPLMINTVDIDGVSLAAAQALERRTAAQQQRIEALEAENAALRSRLERIEALLTPPTPATAPRP